MTPLLIVLIVVGALLVLVGVLLKPVWRVAVRPFYRQPDAQEPSRLGWAVRSGGMILAGGAVIVASASILSQSSVAEPGPSTAARAGCDALIDEVGSPTSLPAAEEAVAGAARSGGYELERDERSSDSVVELPGGDSTVTVDVVTWTVSDGPDAVAAFTWTSSGSVPGRFSATCDRTP
ncbi:MAG: hypothetical protein Q7T71_20840 [Herbiconiux sp.]|nr:hypothetical protein [Herbiconiux sp.]